MVNFFIDTNTIAHYIIFLMLKEKEGETKKPHDKYERFKQSYDFVSKAISLKNKKIIFLVSYLVETELFNAISEEHRCYDMYKGGMPLSYWKHEFSRSLSKEDAKEVEDDIIKFMIDNIYHPELKEKKKIIKSVSDMYDLDIISSLILRKKVKTQDAILISTAFDEKCKYFVTNDENLRRILKSFKRMKLISPFEALEKLNKEIKK